MSTSPSQALDGPIVRDGHTFAVWTTRDLLPLMATLTANRVAILKAATESLNVPPREKAYMLQREEVQGVTALDCYNHLVSPKGVDECLALSLERGGMAKDTITPYLDALRFDQKQELAMRASNIMEYTPLPPLPEAPQTPPAPAGTNKGLGLGDAGQRVPSEPQGLGEGKPPAPNA